MLEDTALNEEPVPGAQDPGDDDPVGMHPALPVLDDAARSQAPGVCPFLRAGADGALAAPTTSPRAGQVCIAVGAPRPQSTSQQEVVCLRGAHVDCPRYIRGSLEPAATRARSAPAVPRATLAALLILVLSAGISLGYVVQRGGLEMPATRPSPNGSAGAAAATPTPGVLEETDPPASAEPTDEVASPGASAEPGSSTGATPTPATNVTPSPAATAKPTPRPTAKPSPATTPRSDRYKLLVKCPDRDGCWIYRIRSGDNLFSIGKYFGHSLKTIYAWNPQYPGTRLRVGAEIRMPPPTR
jgi:hypothetical protein